MSKIYCPLTNGSINYKTCTTCVDMLCEEEHIASNKKIKAQKKKKQINNNANKN